MIERQNSEQLVVIIVTYNSSDFILPCLRNLSATRKNRELQIVVIDNNTSSDNIINIVKNNFPNITLIKNRENIGLPRALNQGIYSVPAIYYLILNPDVLIKSEEIEKLVKHLDRHPDIGIAGPRLEYPDGTMQFSARTFPTIFTILARGIGLVEQKKWLPVSLKKHLMVDLKHQEPKEVDWLLGAALLLRGQMLSEIGYFNEKYFLYYGDVDLCWRARKKGWKIVYYPQVQAVHHYQRASARGGIFNPLKWSHFFSAMRFLIKKNFS